MRGCVASSEVNVTRDFDTAYAATRRAYEFGRARGALIHASLAALLVGGVGSGLLGAHVLAWLPLTFVALAFSEWRGGFLMLGARRGVLGGLGAMLLPLSLLRPCCGVDGKAMGIACCVMPSACWAAGAAIGLGLSLLSPKAPDGRRLEATLGLLLGVLSVSVLRCSPLFLGETVGLLGGMCAALLGAAAARARLHAH